MKIHFENATAAIAAASQAATQVQLPDPVKTAIYSSIAAVVGWAVGALLGWIAKKIGVRQST